MITSECLFLYSWPQTLSGSDHLSNVLNSECLFLQTLSGRDHLSSVLNSECLFLQTLSGRDHLSSVLNSECLFLQTLSGSDHLSSVLDVGHKASLFPRSDNQTSPRTVCTTGRRAGCCKLHAEGGPRLLSQLARQDLRHAAVLPEPDSLLSLQKHLCWYP